MAWYKEIAANSETMDDLIERLYSRIADLVIEALDTVRQAPPLPKGDQAQVAAMYRWALCYAGSGLEALCDEPGYVEDIIAKKMEKGLI